MSEVDTEFTAPLIQWYGSALARRDGALGVFTPNGYSTHVWAETHDDAVMAFIRKAHSEGWEPMYCVLNPTDQ